MRKLINGKYINITNQIQGNTPAKAALKESVAAGGESTDFKAVLGVDISAPALALMAEQPAGIDWGALKGTGAGGKVIKPDVENYIKAHANG